MCIVEAKNSEVLEKEDYPYLVKNCVSDKRNKISFPLSKDRAGNEERAKEAFRDISKCFDKHLAESLILCERTGELDENGREIYKWLYCCKAENGCREIFPYEEGGMYHLNMNPFSKEMSE